VETEQYFFIHGGPGLNSFPERAILGPYFARADVLIDFWDEPSRLRPDGDPFTVENAFRNWCASIARRLDFFRAQGKRVHLLAHSFSIHAVVRLIEPYADVISRVMLFAPCLNIRDAQRNIAELGKMLFLRAHSDKAAEIDEHLSLHRELFDSPMQQALLIASQSPHIFEEYWEDKAQMKRAFDAVRAPEASWDFESFMAVNEDFALDERERAKENRGALAPVSVAIPVDAIFGAKDPLIKIDRELPMLRSKFRNLDVHLFEESGHYPHLEEPRILKRILGLDEMD
jgi:pimeloyl-ACP methyl ester carboxylesterase